MALQDDVVLDFGAAIREINRVERLFDDAFGEPVPVTFDVASGLRSARSDIDRFDEPIDIPVDLDLGRARAEVTDLDQQFDQLSLFDVTQEADRLGTELSQADQIAAELQAEINDIDQEMAAVQRRANRLGDDLADAGRRGAAGFSNMRGTIGAAFAGIASGIILVQGLTRAFDFLGKSFEAASDAEEALSKLTVVFGDFSDEVTDFTQSAPDALGLATREANEFAATFGNLFVGLGLSQDAAAGMSTEIVQLGSDIASFNNLDVDDALIKLRAGLVGEFEALRTLGVALNASIVEQKAFELGLADASGEVSEAAKVQARYALILEQTGTAQGDFARTADGVANSQRTLSAQFANLTEEIGVALLPILSNLLDMGPVLITELERLIPSLIAVGESFTGTAESGESFISFMVDVARVVPSTVGLLGELASAFGNIMQGVVFSDFDSFGDALGDIGDAIDQIALKRLETGFIDDLRAGTDPALALANALVELTSLDLNTEELAAATKVFADIAGIDTGRIGDLTGTLREQGEAAGLSAEEIDTLRRALLELTDIERSHSSRDPAGAARIREQAEAASTALAAEGAALTDLRTQAATAEVSIFTFAQANQEAVDSVLLLASPLERLRIEMELTADEALILAESLKEQLGTPGDFPLFEDLPEQMGVVTGQIEDEAGKMVDVISTAASDVLAQIREQNAAQAAFQANLVALAAGGAEALAQRLREEGPAAAAAAEDFVANLDLALEAEDELTGTGETNATAYGDAVTETLEGLDFTDPAFAAVLRLAQDLSNPTVLASIDAAADVAAARYRNRFLDQITGGAGDVDFSVAPPTSSRPPGSGSDQRFGNMNVTVNLDNFRADDPSGAAARAAAIANQIAGQVTAR